MAGILNVIVSGMFVLVYAFLFTGENPHTDALTSEEATRREFKRRY